MSVSDSEIEATLDAKTLAERRKMQRSIRVQQREAYRQRNMRALEQLNIWDQQIAESIGRTEFPEFFNHANQRR